MVAVFLTAKQHWLHMILPTAALSARAKYAGARNRHLPSLNSDSSGVLPTFAVKLGTSRPWTRQIDTFSSDNSCNNIELTDQILLIRYIYFSENIHKLKPTCAQYDAMRAAGLHLTECFLPLCHFPESGIKKVHRNED